MWRTISASAILACSLTVAPLFADATVYVVHGIPNAVVDVYVAPSGSPPGSPLLEDFAFKTIAGPVNVPAGSYDVWIFAANANPVGDDPILALEGAVLNDGDNLSAVAHLTEAGSPTLSVFANNVSQAGRRVPEQFLSRLQIRHTAAAPKVIAKLNAMFVEVEAANSGEVTFPGLHPGRYQVSLLAAADRTIVPFGPTDLILNGRTLYVAYAVGSLADGTFTVLLQTVRLPQAPVM